MKIVKQGRKRGVITTHQALVHIDDDNWSFWQELSNKSRFVNDMLKSEKIRVAQLYCTASKSDKPIKACLMCACYHFDDCPYWSRYSIDTILKN